MTKVITANNALPSSTLCPDMSTVWKGSAGVPTLNTSADNGSANANDYDGFLATLSGDYNGTGQWVTPGTGGSTANPSVCNSLDGAALTLTGGTVAEIEDVPVPAAVAADQMLPDRDHGERGAGAGDREPDPGFQPSATTYLQHRRGGPCERHRGWPGRSSWSTPPPAVSPSPSRCTPPCRRARSSPGPTGCRSPRPTSVRCWSTARCGTPPSSTTASHGSPTPQVVAHVVSSK